MDAFYGVIAQIYKAEFNLNDLNEVRDLLIIMDSKFHIKRGGSVVYQLNIILYCG